MAAIPARQATVTYAVGDVALTVAGVRSIIRKRALAAADMGLVDLMGEDLENALDGLSMHSLRVGLNSGSVRQRRGCRSHCAGPALVLGRDHAALWPQACARLQCGSADAGWPQSLMAGGEALQRTLSFSENSHTEQTAAYAVSSHQSMP